MEAIDVDHKNVQIQVNGDVVWVNVDGICAFRACKCHYLEVEIDGSNKLRRGEVVLPSEEPPTWSKDVEY